MNTSSVFAKSVVRYGFWFCVLCALTSVPYAGLAAEATSRAKTSSSKAASAANKEKALARIAAMEWQNPIALPPSVGLEEKTFGDAVNGVSFDSLKKTVAAAPKSKSPFSWNVAIGEELPNRDKDFDAGHRYEDFIRRKDKEQNPAGTLLPFKADEMLPAKEVIFGMRVAF